MNLRESRIYTQIKVMKKQSTAWTLTECRIKGGKKKTIEDLTGTIGKIWTYNYFECYKCGYKGECPYF